MKPIIQITFFCLLSFCQAIGQNGKHKLSYVNHTEFGGLFGRVKYGDVTSGISEGVENKLSLAIQTYNGVRLNDRLSVGGTVGMDWYRTALINPLAAGIRFDLVRDRTATFYTSADLGYGFAWFQDDPQGFKTTGGLMINPGLGLRYGKPRGSAFTISLSYKRQDVDVTKPPFTGQVERYEKRVYNRMALRLGMSF